MALSVLGVGTTKKVQSGNLASVAFPASTLANDLAIIFYGARDDVTPSIDQGFVELTGVATDNGTTCKLRVFVKYLVGGDTAPTITHASGAQANAEMLVIRGVANGLTITTIGSGGAFTSFDVDTGSSAVGGAFNVTAASTTVNTGDLAIFFGQFTVADTSGATTNNWSTVTSFTEQKDDCSATTGAGVHCFGLDTWTAPTAGARTSSANASAFGGTKLWIGLQLIVSAAAAGPTVYTSSLSGGVSFVGNNTKLTNYPLSGSLSFVGSLVKKTVMAASRFTGSLSFVGSIAKKAGKALSGAVSFVGSTPSRAIVHVVSSSVSFIGNLNKFTTKSTFTASASFIGNLTKTPSRSLTGSLSFIGSAPSRVIGYVLSGSLSLSGNLNRGITRALSGSVSFIGNLSNTTSRALSGNVGFIGTLAGNLIHGGTLFTQALSGVLSFSGSTSKTPARSLSGSVSFIGSLSKSIAKSLSASLSFSGNIVRTTARGLSAALSFVGNLTATKSGAVGTTTPFFILLTDGRTAMRLGNTLYMPL